MKFVCSLIAAQDLEKSKRFYRDVLGLNVTTDFGANVTLDGGIALQTIGSWQEFIGQRAVTLSHHASELYFEETDMDRFLAHLRNFDKSYVHPPLEHSWGQRVVRFYDPDHHIIEVGEDMVMVVKRFAGSGMTDAQISERMDVPPSYVRHCLES